ncbi:hypothetical protein EV421DRAFT_1671074, partial [Armillaria borealis]
GAVHPYQLVTEIVAAEDVLLVPAVHAHSGYSPSFQTTSSTPHGDIRAKHVVHTTNGWSSHLLAPTRERIVLMHGHMTAQRAGMDLGDGQLGTYTQARPRIDGQQHPDSATLGEKLPAQFMFGGGIEMGTQSFFDAVGCADDSPSSFECRHRLVGYFAREYVAN